MGDVTPLPNTHIEIEKGALDVIPMKLLVSFITEYGLELARIDGRLVIRKVAEGDGPETA